MMELELKRYDWLKCKIEGLSNITYGKIYSIKDLCYINGKVEGVKILPNDSQKELLYSLYFFDVVEKENLNIKLKLGKYYISRCGDVHKVVKEIQYPNDNYLNYDEKIIPFNSKSQEFKQGKMIYITEYTCYRLTEDFQKYESEYHECGTFNKYRPKCEHDLIRELD